jgi:signal transduction histidine kinase
MGMFERTKIGPYIIVLAIVWTLLVSLSLGWNFVQSQRGIVELAKAEARGVYNKDLVYRRWAAGHGGVYVPATEETPPSPFLAHVDERDIISPSGRDLTLVNPAYMTRQVHELARAQYGLRGHITSLNPLRPENAPDSWEADSLTAFEQGVVEVSSVEEMGSESCLRFMRPMITEARCLKCHAEQGYKPGDIRGGISVAVPLAPYKAVAVRHVAGLAIGHGALWILGLTGLCCGASHVRERVRQRDRAEHELREVEKALEDQRRQQQRLESIGTLAGGVAHEINNPVNGVMNYAQLIIDKTDDADVRIRELAGEIVNETERVALIVRNLLQFARQSNQQHQSPARMADITTATLSLIQTVMRHDQIQLQINVPEDLPTVKCRSQQIQQVLMNLMTNARDALNERYPEYHENKTMSVVAREIEEDGTNWLRTTVEDHGTGISQEVCDHLFEPFYTTKPDKSGTGLGLSISHGIVKDHGGRLTVESEVGKYTRFHMDLPVR